MWPRPHPLAENRRAPYFRLHVPEYRAHKALLLMASIQLDSTLVLSLLFVLSCFAVIRSLWSGRKDSSRVLPPSHPTLPIIGNLHQLGRGILHRKLQVLAQQHGSLFLLRLGTVPTLVVTSASMAEEVLKNQDHIFCGRPQQHTARGLMYDCRDVGFSPYGERWRQLRRIAVVHLLSVKRVDSFRVLREEEPASLVGRIRTASSPESTGAKQRAVNLSHLIVSLTYTVVSRAAFGNKLGGMDTQVFRETATEVFDLLETIAVSDMFPRLWWVDWLMGLDARTKRTAKKLDGVLERALQEHEKSSGSNNGKSGDLLDDLLSVVKEGGEGLKLDRVDVKGLIFDLFIAGVDTTSKAIEWAMAELIKNPREMAKLQDEPERFMHHAIDYNGKDFRFIPFSAGRRGCPGIVFATRLAELALANLMYHFDWELPEGQDVESFEVVESSGLSPALKFPLILVAKPLQE
ncbi:hypothetical protein HU200_023966 [Digitaria exilis]|uniref:Cytochrome P450 n=1 Tax=Digitaria exilis TaxID=1010633 RepID=A0A835EVR0_9POAL|nr:hypothetical protein HU200_023966 [Digitaria exilis]